MASSKILSRHRSLNTLLKYLHVTRAAKISILKLFISNLTGNPVMAGIPSHTKSGSSKRTAGSAREKGKNPQSGERKHGGSSNSIQHREQSPETPTSRPEAVSVQLTSSRNNASDWLFITTSEPNKFKDPTVRKEISRHVMKNYQDRQLGKESTSGKAKEPTKFRGDKGTGSSSSFASSSQTVTRESSVSYSLKVCPMGANDKQNYMSEGPNMLIPRALHSSALTQDMIYPLNIDLSSLDFQHRLGHLLSRYMRVCKS